MAERNKVTLRIAGKDYKIMGSESDEYMQRVGLYIDRKMNEITKSSVKLNTAMASILAAINVADDYFKAREAETYYKDELIKIKRQIEEMRKNDEQIKNELEKVKRQNTELQLSLAKREAELAEVRNSKRLTEK